MRSLTARPWRRSKLSAAAPWATMEASSTCARTTARRRRAPRWRGAGRAAAGRAGRSSIWRPAAASSALAAASEAVARRSPRARRGRRARAAWLGEVASRCGGRCRASTRRRRRRRARTPAGRRTRPAPPSWASRRRGRRRTPCASRWRASRSGCQSSANRSARARRRRTAARRRRGSVAVTSARSIAGGAGAPRLAPAEAPAGPSGAGAQQLRSRRPHAAQRRPVVGRAELVEDRQRVEVALGEAGQRAVGGAELGERSPALRRSGRRRAAGSARGS